MNFAAITRIRRRFFACRTSAEQIVHVGKPRRDVVSVGEFPGGVHAGRNRKSRAINGARLDKLQESISVEFPLAAPSPLPKRTPADRANITRTKKPFSPRANVPFHGADARRGNDASCFRDGPACRPLPIGFRLSIILLLFFQIIFLYTRHARARHIRPGHNIRIVLFVRAS